MKVPTRCFLIAAAYLLTFSFTGCDSREFQISAFEGEWVPTEEGDEKIVRWLLSADKDEEAMDHPFVAYVLDVEHVVESLTARTEGNSLVVHLNKENSTSEEIQLKCTGIEDGDYIFEPDKDYGISQHFRLSLDADQNIKVFSDKGGSFVTLIRAVEEDA